MLPRNPFADAVDKVRRSGYGSLTDAEKWDWHADVYGYRRVRQGISAEVTTSPSDPDGVWFDKRRADVSERYYRERYRMHREAA